MFGARETDLATTPVVTLCCAKVRDIFDTDLSNIHIECELRKMNLTTNGCDLLDKGPAGVELHGETMMSPIGNVRLLFDPR